MISLLVNRFALPKDVANTRGRRRRNELGYLRADLLVLWDYNRFSRYLLDSPVIGSRA